MLHQELHRIHPNWGCLLLMTGGETMLPQQFHWSTHISHESFLFMITTHLSRKLSKSLLRRSAWEASDTSHSLLFKDSCTNFTPSSTSDQEFNASCAIVPKCQDCMHQQSNSCLPRTIVDFCEIVLILSLCLFKCSWSEISFFLCFYVIYWKENVHRCLRQSYKMNSDFMTYEISSIAALSLWNLVPVCFSDKWWWLGKRWGVWL